MHSMSRQFGKLWSKGPGDNAKVSVLLSDYRDVDQVLAKVIDNNKIWRDAWMAIINTQLQTVVEYEGLYDPIVGASDGHGRPSKPAPEAQLSRTYGLKRVYDELKTEMVEEVGMIEERILKPAGDARDCLFPFRKVIEKRENKRLDYEKAQDRVHKLARKPGRAPKEDAALAKAEEEVTRAAEKFNAADENVRMNLPPIVNAAFSLVPPLLAAHVLIQNRLLGLYYTTLHGYCDQFGFPSPPPPMEDVIATWNASFRPIQSEVESISFIARGKAAQQPMGAGGSSSERNPSAPPPPNVGFRRSPSYQKLGQAPPANNGPTPRTLRIPSTASLRAPSPTRSSVDPSPNPSPTPSVRRADYLAPTDFTTATILGGGPVDKSPSGGGGRSPGASPNSLRPRTDYFGNGGSYERPSTASTIASTISLQGSQVSGSYTNANGNGNGGNGIVVGKKKPPPPPPPKRILSGRTEEWVVALYEFASQGQGDLSFREGDRIKIVKKTGTDQDWWVGELNGVRGSFPANYCRAA